MTRHRQEAHARMLDNGLRTRPAELERRMESACETCAYFRTGPEFVPVLLRQRDHGRQSGQSDRAARFEGLVNRARRRLDTDYTYNAGSRAVLTISRQSGHLAVLLQSRPTQFLPARPRSRSASVGWWHLAQASPIDGVSRPPWRPQSAQHRLLSRRRQARPHARQARRRRIRRQLFSTHSVGHGFPSACS